jgi:hypothetical protein
MALDIRSLFKKYKIDFRDSGKNVSRGSIVIQCPYCGSSDKSEHMNIREETGQYYCFRNPRHAGNILAFLLRVLKIPASEYGNISFEDAGKAYIEDTRDYSEWQYFTPAEDSEEALTYLSSRLFSNPAAIAKQFDLRVSKQGKWAGRLIIPLTIGWTGRAMRSHMELRYKAWTNEGGFFLYKQGSSSLIILEGGLDGIRAASVTTQFDVIGKCRIAYSPALFAYIREANYSSIYIGPDATVARSIIRAEKKLLQSYCPSTYIEQITMYEDKKDFCATPETDTRKILNTLGNHELSALQ